MDANVISDRNEFGFEAYYRDKIYNGIFIQPDFQYIINPGTVSGADSVTALGLRLEINF